MLKKYFFGLLLLTFLVQHLPAQNKIIDSLQTGLKTEKEDTNKVNTLNLISTKLREIDSLKSSEIVAQQALLLAKKTNFPKGQTNAYNCLGIAYQFEENYSEALLNFNKVLELKKASGDQSGVASYYNNIGVIYKKQGNYQEALKNYSASLDIYKVIGDKFGIAGCYGNIGNLCEFQGNYSEAMKNFLQCLAIEKSIKNKKGIANAYNSIGNIYMDQGNYSEALINFSASLKIKQEISDDKGMANTYCSIGQTYVEQGNYPDALKNLMKALEKYQFVGEKDGISNVESNIGIIYEDQGNYSEALKNYLASFQLSKTIGDKSGLANFYNNMGELNTKLKKYNEAKKNLNQGLLLSKEMNEKVFIKNNYYYADELDSAIGNWKGAYENNKMYIIYRDSLINEANTKKIIQSQMQYEFDIKTTADSIKNVELTQQEELKQAQQIKQQKIYAYGGIVGFLLMLIVAGVSLRAYTNKLKANTLLEEKNTEIADQKTVVEQKNTEITSSINYALRIQTAILPPFRIVKNYLPNSFIVYKPKDIVAGDFYWMENVENKILFAAADCTGHGVPGAMVSVVCHNALNRAVREFGLIQPAEILDKTAQLIIENFAKSEDEIKDGMDISLCSLEQMEKGVKLQWSGANSPLWIIKNGELQETKADKQSVGNSETHQTFNNHEFELVKGDVIYIFSDGFADQFGGEGEKKLTRKRFKELLLSIQNKNLEEQGNELNRFIDNYRKEIEQTDDILVMGVKV